MLSFLFRRGAPLSVVGADDGVVLGFRKDVRAVSHEDVLELSMRWGLLGRRLIVRTSDGTEVLRGLRGAEARGFVDGIRSRWVEAQRRVLDQWYEQHRPSIEFVLSLSDPRRFARSSRVARHSEQIRALLSDLEQRSFNELGEHRLLEIRPRLSAFTSDTKRLVFEANQLFVHNERERCRELFETIESNPLTEKQQVAVVTDEDRNLVVAAAGSGKTSVIIAKIAHILKQGDLDPSQLLVLAFNRAARDELRERIATKVDVESISKASVMTFHGLGYSIIGAATNKRPSVAKHAGEAWKAARLIREILDELSSDAAFERRLDEWFVFYLHEYKSAFDFETLGEYYEFLARNQIVTLNGEVVKSFEECEIANFLSMNGVNYEYEAAYEHATADATHRQYEPDFYLPDHGIYIEHFGIDRDGRTAPFIDAVEYRAGMKWKRALHEEHGTELVETYSYERREGTLLSSLGKQLTQRGVAFRPVSPAERLEGLRKSSTYDRFSDLIAVFLGHYISNGEDRSGVEQRASQFLDRQRAKVFLEIFWPVCEQYVERMTAANEVDFEMMIRDATKVVMSGQYASRYRYILVDEFQDISVGRAKMLKSLLDQHPESQLFAVGDDWQSIYRFAGSDISVMRNFEQTFGPTATTNLSTTFRCNQQLVDLSSKFVSANPAQLSKQVKGLRERSGAAAFIWRYPLRGEVPVAEALQRIREEARSATVLVLGRYRHNKPEKWRQLRGSVRDLEIEFQTVHSAKGLEADFVIVLGLSAGTYGFPSEIEDDPLMNLVLAEQERFVHAEERRLFYVAITRARHAVILLAPESGESAFIREIERQGYGTESLGSEPAELPRCPSCTSGVRSVRSGEHGSFVGCSNYPRCTRTAAACPTCRAGVVEVKRDSACCVNCGAEFEACPRCSLGYLRVRRGKHGAFWGCSSYPACSHTRPMRAS